MFRVSAKKKKSVSWAAPVVSSLSCPVVVASPSSLPHSRFCSNLSGGGRTAGRHAKDFPDCQATVKEEESLAGEQQQRLRLRGSRLSMSESGPITSDIIARVDSDRLEVDFPVAVSVDLVHPNSCYQG